MADETKPNFEDALARIEKIVADLERGEPALSVALAKYESGVKLLRECYHLLDEAEHSVALLTGSDEQGNPITTPFDATATLAREPSTPRGRRPEPKPKPTGRSPRPKARPVSQEDDSDLPDAPF